MKRLLFSLAVCVVLAPPFAKAESFGTITKYASKSIPVFHEDRSLGNYSELPLPPTEIVKVLGGVYGVKGKDGTLLVRSAPSTCWSPTCASHAPAEPSPAKAPARLWAVQQWVAVRPPTASSRWTSHEARSRQPDRRDVVLVHALLLPLTA